MMTTTLGKRKRRAARPAEEERRESSEESVVPELDAQEIFRRHFEAQFKPLPVVQRKLVKVEEEPEDESDEASVWGGIFEEEDTVIEVVEHTNAESRMAAMSKEELKTFMTSRPPSSTPKIPLLRDKAGAVIDDDDASESANLKKDLALQRLLAESHLLESSTNPTLSGTNRHKATDLRLQALGSKKSILKQEKMPMSHRKGIIAKQSEREETRRREARENGIILEKVKVGNKKGGDGKRDRGVGAPGVGKFSGGTLKLSKKDIFDIEGPKNISARRGGRGGGGRGGSRGSVRGRGKRE